MRSGSFARVVIAGLGVSVVITLGCGKPPTDPSPSPTVTVEFGGRVVNADSGGPIGNVLVSFAGVSLGERETPFEWQYLKATATSREDGTFTLPLNLPMGWRRVSFNLIAPPGYDDTFQRFVPTTAADRPAIRMYPTLVIGPGESIAVRVEGIEQCGYGGEAGSCRRVLVAASPGDPVELELVPDDSSKPMGLSPDNYFGTDTPVPRLMVPPGGFPYVIGAGTGRLRARR